MHHKDLKRILPSLTKEIKKFLETKGLQINRKKTKICHITEGLDFLGRHLQLMPRLGKLNKKSEQKNLLIIKPTNEGVKRVPNSIKGIFQKYEPNWVSTCAIQGSKLNYTWMMHILSILLPQLRNIHWFIPLLMTTDHYVPQT